MVEAKTDASPNTLFFKSVIENHSYYYVYENPVIWKIFKFKTDPNK
jgi:hypothetical protein